MGATYASAQYSGCPFTDQKLTRLANILRRTGSLQITTNSRHSANVYPVFTQPSFWEKIIEQFVLVVKCGVDYLETISTEDKSGLLSEYIIKVLLKCEKSSNKHIFLAGSCLLLTALCKTSIGAWRIQVNKNSNKNMQNNMKYCNNARLFASIVPKSLFQ